MALFFTQILRSRWFTICLHVAFWVLLYFAAANLGGKAPLYQENSAGSSTAQSIAPVNKLESVLSARLPQPDTNALSGGPFFTRYFVPPPTPAPPPPPTTRKIEVTYQGFYQTLDGPKFAVLNVAGGLMIAKIGALVATNVYVADATLLNVTLTNTTAQTNILTLNAKKEIEVPIR